jgi:hypothetical protein
MWRLLSVAGIVALGFLVNIFYQSVELTLGVTVV